MRGWTGRVNAGVGVVCILIAISFHGWWTGDKLVAQESVGLLGVRVCLADVCETASLEGAPQPFQTLATLTFGCGMGVAVLLAAAALLSTRSQWPLGKLASLGSAVFGALALAVVLTFHGRGVSMSWGFPVAELGAVVGFVAGFVLSLESSGVWEGRTYVPVKVEAHPAPSRPVAPPAEPTGSAAPLPPAPRVAPPTTAARPAQRPDLGSFKDAVAGRHRPQNQRMSSVGPAGADSAARAVRFFVETCTIDDAGLTATYRGGAQVTLAWAHIVSLAARLLPVDPPYEKTVMVDLVPAAGDGLPTPVRLLPSSRVTYAALPGGAAMSSLDNLRKLGAHVCARNPQATIEPESAAFFHERRPPPALLGVAQLEAFDRRYAAE